MTDDRSARRRELPFLGPEASGSHIAVCEFRINDTSPSCLADADWHGLVLTDDGTGLIALLTCCGDHKSAMALTADFIHEYCTACPLEESTIWWGPGDASGCRIDWDAVSLAAAEAVPVAAGRIGRLEMA